MEVIVAADKIREKEGQRAGHGEQWSCTMKAHLKNK